MMPLMILTAILFVIGIVAVVVGCLDAFTSVINFEKRSARTMSFTFGILAIIFAALVFFMMLPAIM